MLHVSLFRAAHSAPSHSRTTPRFSRLLAAASGLALTSALATPLAPPGQALAEAGTALETTSITLGASGDQAGLSRSINAPLAFHAFGKMMGAVPNGRLINMAPEMRWASVADAPAGSDVYNNIVRWANTLKARSTPVMVAFNHEPEESGDAYKGTSDEFIRAWRKVVTIFRAQGATNVQFTWTMTAYSFRVSSGDRRYAAKWYPGDAYVDYVGADAYNWASCGPGQGNWRSLSYLATAALNFAKAHSKKLVLPEWASQADARRASWLRDAHNWLKANQANMRAAFYYNPAIAPRSDCHWKLNTAAEFDAFGDMARDGAFTNN